MSAIGPKPTCASALPMSAFGGKADICLTSEKRVFLDAFRQGLRELGYVEGRDIALEVRNAEGYSQRLGALANILAELKVDVILALNTPSVQAAKKATVTIPIVMTQIADPLKSGLVTDLSRPGVNVTGIDF